MQETTFSCPPVETVLSQGGEEIILWINHNCKKKKKGQHSTEKNKIIYCFYNWYVNGCNEFIYSYLTEIPIVQILYLKYFAIISVSLSSSLLIYASNLC